MRIKTNLALIPQEMSDALDADNTNGFARRKATFQKMKSSFYFNSLNDNMRSPFYIFTPKLRYKRVSLFISAGMIDSSFLHRANQSHVQPSIKSSSITSFSEVVISSVDIPS